MTEIDARQSAEAEAKARNPDHWGPDDAGFQLFLDYSEDRKTFIDGAQWAVEQLPSRDAIADVLSRSVIPAEDGWIEGPNAASRLKLRPTFLAHADAVLALIREAYEQS